MPSLNFLCRGGGFARLRFSSTSSDFDEEDPACCEAVTCRAQPGRGRRSDKRGRFEQCSFTSARVLRGRLRPRGTLARNALFHFGREGVACSRFRSAGRRSTVASTNTAVAGAAKAHTFDAANPPVDSSASVRLILQPSGAAARSSSSANAGQVATHPKIRQRRRDHRRVS